MRLLDRWWFVVASMALALTLMLHTTLHTGFYEGDDREHVAVSLGKNWSDFNVTTISAMPLARFSYRIDYYLFHPTSQPAQLTGSVDVSALNDWAPTVRCMSGFYHLLAAIVLWCFLRRLKAPAGVAYLVGLVWAAHPSACESVCWISERKTVLTALFGFAALLAWTADRRYLWRLPLSYFLFMLAQLCKASALGFLPVFAALELFDPIYKDSAWSDLRRWRNVILSLAIPVLICVGIMAQCIGGSYSRELVDPPGGTVFTALLTDVEIFGRYMVNTLAPYDLCFFYGVRPIQSLGDYRLWSFAILEIALIVAVILKTERSYRSLSVFGLIWFFGALGPHSNLIATPHWMHDRYMYLAMPGLLLAVTLALHGLLTELNSRMASRATATDAPALSISSWAGVAYALLILALLIQRAAVYCDFETVILDAAPRQPLSSQARLLAGSIFEQQFVEHRPEGSHPDAQLAFKFGSAAYAYQSAALDCPDLPNFDEPFGVKVHAVVILLHLGDYEGVRQALAGWLPPPHLKMLKVKRNDGTAVLSRSLMLRGYFPQVLSHAWGVMAETSIAQSQTPKLPLKDRVALLDRAMEEAKKSLEVWDQEDDAQIMLAKVLLYSAAAETANGNLDQSKEKFDRGMAILNSLPKDTPHAMVIQYLISHPPMPAPQPESKGSLPK